MAADCKRVHLRVNGLVQGVFFRQTAKEEAQGLGLRGWVRNRRDGDVEAVVEGPNAAVDEFVDWCREGPPHARVASVQVEESPATGEFLTFRIEHA